MPLPEYQNLAGVAAPAAGPSHLKLMEENEATGEVAELYEHFRTHFGRPRVPGILKCFATHPPLLRHMMALSESLIFSDGHLPRREKEMIATLVSSENRCPYCADSHGYFFRFHGGTAEALCAIQHAELDSDSFTDRERALLEFVRKVNRSSSEIGRPDIDRLVEHGFSEDQVAEAVHVAALFATFNRVANSFGLESQGLLSLYEDSAVRSDS